MIVPISRAGSYGCYSAIFRNGDLNSLGVVHGESTIWRTRQVSSQTGQRTAFVAKDEATSVGSGRNGYAPL